MTRTSLITKFIVLLVLMLANPLLAMDCCGPGKTCSMERMSTTSCSKVSPAADPTCTIQTSNCACWEPAPVAPASDRAQGPQRHDSGVSALLAAFTRPKSNGAPKTLPRRGPASRIRAPQRVLPAYQLFPLPPPASL